MILKKFPIARFLVLAFSLLLLAGCPGSDHSESDASFERPQRPGPPIAGAERKTIDQMLAQSTVGCAESSCPEAIGQIVARETTVLGPWEGTCSGWLVSADIVATNSHCIPRDVKDGRTPCRDAIGIKFPAENGWSEESYFCSSLLSFSDLSKPGYSSSDYAFFRIKGSSRRTPLRIEPSPSRMEWSLRPTPSIRSRPRPRPVLFITNRVWPSRGVLP